MRLVWACAGLAALPALVAAAASIGADWTPASDYAPIEVRARDVFSAHPPLLGAYSRLGGSHPGPALFYLLAVPYRLLGSQPWALLVSAALINGACIALTVRIAGRKGQVGLATALAALILACTWGLGVEHLRDVWNPRLPVFPFLLSAVAAWAAVVGSRRSLPIALASASFAVQSHVGYAALAAVIFLWCAFAVGSHRHDWRAWRAPILLSVVLVGVMWTPPLVQQVLGDEGNLTRIVRQANDTGEAEYGLSGIEDFLLPHLGPTPAWFRTTPDDPFELRGRTGLPWPPLGLVAFVAGVAVGAWRRDRSPLVLMAVTASLWVAGAWSLSQLSGLPAPYLYRWVRVLGILLWTSALWPLGRALLAAARRRRLGGRLARAPWPGRSLTAAPTLVVGGLLAALAVGVAAGEADTPFVEYRERYARTAVVADEALAAVRRAAPPGRHVEVRWQGALVFTVPAVVADLERAGYHVLVDVGSESVWGDHRTPGATRPDLLLLLTDDPAAGPDTDLRRVARVDMLSPEQRVTYEGLPPPERCQPVSAPGDGTAEERRTCRRRSELAADDRHVEIFIGGPAA